MPVTSGMVLIVCPLVFLASLIDAIGGGGGLISLPAYMLAVLPTALASGSNKFSSSCGLIMSTYKYARSGKILLKPAACAIAGALPGAYLGAELLKRTPEPVIRAIMLTVIPVMAVILLLKRDSAQQSKPMNAARYIACLIVGLLCGFYDGFCGPGAGTLMIMGLTWMAGMSMITANGSAKLVNLASNAGALVSHLINGNVVFGLALPAMVCSVAGAWCGAKLALKKGSGMIRWVMCGVLVLLLAKLIFESITA